MRLKLVIGNKNYSSWSMRPWIAMTQAGIPFEEELIPLYEPGSAERIRQYSPTGKVPVLIADGQAIWESLAILEYLADAYPQAMIWPACPAQRAHARAVATEMHGGFAPLRRACPMNMWMPPRNLPLSEEVSANVARIEAIWTECRSRHAGAGPFLFGQFGAADAMYAPVVSRFDTYGIAVGPVVQTYMDTVRALPAWREWRRAALAEPWVHQHNEPDWPHMRKLET